MKRYGHLFDKIITFENLSLAYKKAARGKKDKNSVMSFSFNFENELLILKQDIQNKTYHPKPYSTFEVKEPKVRKICSSEFRDRSLIMQFVMSLNLILKKDQFLTATLVVSARVRI